MKSALAGAVTLAVPQIGRTAAQQTITFVPHADLASLDPVWTTADITRNFASAVYDTLYGHDADFRVQEQQRLPASAFNQFDADIIHNDGGRLIGGHRLHSVVVTPTGR